MDYTDVYYGETATLARSIYGKRAASSFVAAAATIRRRQAALKGSATSRSDAAPPQEFEGLEGELSLAVEDDDVWQRAETAVVASKSRDKKAELAAIDGILHVLQQAMDAAPSSKWSRCLALLAQHGIHPGTGQLLVFTEFADTARWLTGEFAGAGFSVETLEGSVGHLERDKLQQRFVARDFQVLVSTDAGGEGIDLQSAHVMVNWDIPWSLVRLEQRMGRLHRIGQEKPVMVYRLVAAGTIEEKVMALKERKARLFDAVVDDGTPFGTALGADDIRALLA
jgi:SNF2 family DNA or RNA helicase